MWCERLRTQGEVYCQFCETHSDCRDSEGYGLGYVCEDTENNALPQGKYCEPMAEPERCTAEPQDVWSNWNEYQNHFLIGELYDYSSDQEKIDSSFVAFTGVDEFYDELQFVQISCDYSNFDLYFGRYQMKVLCLDLIFQC